MLHVKWRFQYDVQVSRQKWEIKKYLSYFSAKTYVVETQKNCLKTNVKIDGQENICNFMLINFVCFDL